MWVTYGYQVSFDAPFDLDWTPSMPLAIFNLSGFDMSDGVYVIWRPEPDTDLPTGDLGGRWRRPCGIESRRSWRSVSVRSKGTCGQECLASPSISLIIDSQSLFDSLVEM